VLEEKAEDLGRVLGQTEEYKALRRATEALRDDPSKGVAEAERLAGDRAVAQRGKEPTKDRSSSMTLRPNAGKPGYQQMVAQANFKS
jgi:cell fate (sporulation/competence/biofilm development) regulator YlbF (YheA/YmcA/DUF963 family)